MDDKEKLESLERDKEQLIRRYMSLQDQADAISDDIYQVCCNVEALNLRISLLKEEMRKAALKASPVNGKTMPPTNGKTLP